MKQIMIVVGAAIFAAVLSAVLTWPDREKSAAMLAPVDAGQVDNWADNIIQSMRENRARYRVCHEALCKCVGAASFAVPAVDRLVKNHPELISEITDLWAQYYVLDAGCCEVEQ